MVWMAAGSVSSVPSSSVTLPEMNAVGVVVSGEVEGSGILPMLEPEPVVLDPGRVCAFANGPNARQAPSINARNKHARPKPGAFMFAPPEHSAIKRIICPHETANATKSGHKL